jgi:lysophospholipase L1-like esterase
VQASRLRYESSPKESSMQRIWIWSVVMGLAVSADALAGNPAEKPLTRNIDRHKKFLELAKSGNPEVVFLGDSITQGWEGAGKEAWKKNFEPLKSFNFGIGGDQTGHVLWRLTEGGEFETVQPKVVVLMIGTNNTGKHNAEQIAGGIGAIVKTIQEKSPKTKVLLLAVFPRAAKADAPPRVKIGEINKIISKLDNGKSVRYLDIGPKFLQEDGTLTKEIMPDLLHLSPRGYEIWAEAITPTLKEMLAQ